MTEFVLSDVENFSLMNNGQWWYFKWWRNFIDKHCTVIAPHLVKASGQEQIAALQEFLVEYNAKVVVEESTEEGGVTQSIIFQSEEDYFAFVLEWS